jgi:hypothetical protein
MPHQQQISNSEKESEETMSKVDWFEQDWFDDHDTSTTTQTGGKGDKKSQQVGREVVSSTCSHAEWL